MSLLEKFEVHDELNPKLWVNDKLLPDVKDRIIKIIKHFKEFIDTPLEIADVVIVGSNASYNYTDNSDLDIHLITNFDLVDAPKELLQSLYNSQKSLYNKSFDITIHGINAEVYVDDINSNVTSNGIYSVFKDEWVKKPQPITNVPQHNIESDLSEWSNLINSISESGDIFEIKNTINDLYLLRKNSLATEGEYGRGNQIFKELRAMGLLDRIKDAFNKATSKTLSLESLARHMTIGQLMNLDL